MNRLAVSTSLAVSLLIAPACGRSSAAVVPELGPPADEVWVTQQQAAQLRIGVVQKRPVEDTLRVGGRVTFDDLRISHVFSPVTGRVLRVLAAPGARVKKGTPLAVLSSPDAASTRSDVVKAQSDVDASSHEYQRQKELYEAHAGPLKDLESSENGWKKARAEFQRARQKAQLLGGSVGSDSQEYTLRAPIDGEVVSRTVNPGTEVQGQYAGGNAVELFTVGELDEVLVVADLHELDIAQLRVGQPVTVQVVSYPGRTLPGAVEWISSALDGQTHTAKVRCRIRNPDRLLKPEMYATVTSQVSSDVLVAALPRSALVHLGEQTLVFVSRGETPNGKVRFERRPVKVNEDVSGALYPVQSGLSEGEAVVTDGAILLSQAG